MCDFRDSSSKSWDYTSFIRMYALYLDEQLEFRLQGHRGRSGGSLYHGEEGNGGAASNAVVAKGTHVSEMNDKAVFSRIKHLTQLLDRLLACRPTGTSISCKFHEFFFLLCEGKTKGNLCAFRCCTT